jgi:WD40 repeat protein
MVTTMNKTAADISKTEKRQFDWPRIFGYDFFISFKLGTPPIGSQSYASDLARRLRELDYTVFFSEEEAPPGAVLDTTLVKALHRSKILVVIANEGALLHSQWVRKEVEEFRRKHPNRPVIPINVDKSIQTLGTQAEAALWLGHEGRIWLDESKEALYEGIISPEVLNRLLLEPRFTKANTKFKRIVIVIILLLLSLTFWAIREAYNAKLKFEEATAIRLTIEGNAMTSGIRPGGQLIGVLNVLAGHRLLRPESADSASGIRSFLKQLVGYHQPSLANTYGALQIEYNRFDRLRYRRETSSSINAVVYSPDGKTIVSGSDDKSLMFWDAATGKVIGKPLEGHENEVTSIAFSPDGKTIVSGSTDGTLRRWDAKAHKALGEAIKGHIGVVTSVAFSPSGKVIVSGGFDNTSRLWDAATGRAIGQPLEVKEDTVEIEGHNPSYHVNSVAFSPNGKVIASGTNYKTLRLWDAATGRAIGEPLIGHNNSVDSVAFSPDGKIIVSGSYDNNIMLWDAETHKAIGGPLTGHHNGITSVAFSPDGKTIVSGGYDDTIRRWDVDTGKTIGEPFIGHKGTVTSVALSPDGKTIVSGSRDKTLRLWDVGTDMVMGELNKSYYGDVIISVAISPDGKTIVSGSGSILANNNNLRLWDIATGKPIRGPFIGHKESINSVAFSPDGKTIVSGSDDKSLMLWDAFTGKAIGEAMTGFEDIVKSVVFSPDGKTIVSGSWDKTIRLWDVKTHKVIGEALTGHQDSVTSIDFSPDGKSFVSGSVDKNLMLWDAAGKAIGKPLEGHEDYVSCVAFSPDGKTIVSGSWDKTLRLWDTKTHKALGDALEGHEDLINSIAFSPDGKVIVSGGGSTSAFNFTLRLWDAATGKVIGKPLEGHENEVTSVAFSPDGKTIVSGSRDGTLRRWDVLEGWADALCSKLERNMSHKEWREQVSPDIDYTEQCPGLSIPQDKP